MPAACLPQDQGTGQRVRRPSSGGRGSHRPNRLRMLQQKCRNIPRDRASREQNKATTGTTAKIRRIVNAFGSRRCQAAHVSAHVTRRALAAYAWISKVPKPAPMGSAAVCAKVPAAWPWLHGHGQTGQTKPRSSQNSLAPRPWPWCRGRQGNQGLRVFVQTPSSFPSIPIVRQPWTPINESKVSMCMYTHPSMHAGMHT